MSPRSISKHRPLTGTLLWMLLGPIVWALHLTIVYGTHTLACVGAPEGPAMGMRLLIGAATVIAVVFLLGLTMRPYGLRWPTGKTNDPSADFLARATAALALLSAFGVALAGTAILFLPACLALR